ncbi:MAG: hypothetical protein M1830_002945 [Pleopsidium flavum]|nr:MAG: hypothetical protein M1830_002945 [Pleopsidium flavum]
MLGVDYADAVTGFEFKGRHGTAVIKGIVAAVEYREAVVEVIKGFQDERAQAEEASRTLEALSMWRRFMAGLRIRERIDGYDIEGERDAAPEEMGKVDEEVEEADGGGFLPDRDQEEVAEPTVGRFRFPRNRSSGDEEGGFMAENSNGDSDGEEALRNIETSREPHLAEEHVSHLLPNKGGGFIFEDALHESGRFIPEESERSPEIFLQAKSDIDNLVIGQGSADVELADAIILQRLHEEGSFLPNDNSGGGGFITEEDLEQTTPDVSEHVEDHSRQETVNPNRQAGMDMDAGTAAVEVHQALQVIEDEEEQEDDKGSLLSHDPEDEDADPEWLASDQE